MNIFQNCTANLNQGQMLIPDKPETLRQMCLDGAKKLAVFMDDEYTKRLDYELSVIESKNFEDYFYIVADLIQAMYKVQAVGPGRGSSAGSLVAFLLGITRIDPIKYGLMFERFLDPNRTDEPDVDIDFADRDMAIDYLINKYGENRVARLGTIANWQAKNTINEVSKSLDLSRFSFDGLLKDVPTYAAGDSRADTALADTLENHSILNRFPESKVMARLAGTPSHASQHAAGVVLTQGNVSEIVAIDNRTGAIHANMHDAEAMGLLKLDCLGVSTLALITNILNQLNKNNEWLDNIPLDDQKAFDVLNDGKFSSIFQFSGKALKELTRTLRVDNFLDLSALSALARPGASSGADKWVRRRQGLEAATYPHACLEPYLKDTFGVLVYQEQIMKIAREVCGLSWVQVTGLRKAIGKSKGEAAMAEYGIPFIQGLVDKGMSQDDAQLFWNNVLESGAYAFNKSHSIAYGLVSYQTCYLKAHYPMEFAAAALTMEKEKSKQIAILRELDKEGVKYTPFDIEKSTDKWRVVNGELLGPLQMVIGVGPKNVQNILSCRARGEPLPDSLQKKLANAKSEVDDLYAIESMLKNAGLEAKSFSHGIKPIKDWKPNGKYQEGVKIAGLVTSIEVQDENDPKRVAARLERGQGGHKSGETRFLKIVVEDSTGEFYVKVPSKDYDRRSKSLIENIEKGSLVVCQGAMVFDIENFMINEFIWGL